MIQVLVAVSVAPRPEDSEAKQGCMEGVWPGGGGACHSWFLRHLGNEEGQLGNRHWVRLLRKEFWREEAMKTWWRNTLTPINNYLHALRTGELALSRA